MALRISTSHAPSLPAALVGATLLASAVLPALAPAAHAQDAIVAAPNSVTETVFPVAAAPAVVPATAPSAPEMSPALWLGQSYYSPPEN